MSRARRACATALAACLLLCVSPHALALQPGDCMPDDLVVPTLDGNLTVPRDGSANTPLLAMGLDPADPFSTAMWVAPASLDALLLRAPEGAHFLFFSHSNDSAETDAQWMRQRLLSRAHVLQLPSDQLDQLLQRLHFATQPPAAMGGWLPQLLEQWQMPRRIVRARAQPQRQLRQGAGSRRDQEHAAAEAAGSAAAAAAARAAQPKTAAAAQPAVAGQEADAPLPAGRPPLRSVASGRLDAFYGWLPWPLTGLQGDLAFAGWDCEWIRPSRRLRFHLNGSVALVALSAFPGETSEAAAAAAAAADGEVLPRHSSAGDSSGSGSGSGSGRSSDGGSSSAGSSAGSSGTKWQPRPRCSYARIVQAAEAAGATAVLLAAPAGRFPREANCSCPEECGAELSIPASMVPHSIGVVLRDVLRAGDRVNVSFEEEQGPGLWAGIDASGSLIELGWPKVASLLHGVWAAQYQAYLQGLQERLAAPAHVIPIFKGDKAFEDTGRPLRKSVTLPNWSKLAGKDQVELDMQLSCAGTTDADCPTYDHVIQLFVCCGTADGMLPPCEPCQPTVWAGSSGSAGGSGSSSSGGDSSSSGGSGMSLPLLPGAAAARHNGSARALAAAWQEQPALVQGQSNGQKCGRELGRWITPLRRRVGRWLTDVSALRPLLLPAPRLLRMQCTFTLQAPAWAGPWQPTLSLRFSSGPTEVMQMADGAAVDDGSGGSSYGGSSSSMERQAAAATAGSAPANPQQQAPLQRQPQQQRCSQSAAAQHVQRVLPLPFSGGDFGPGYNNRTAAGYNFTTPPGLRRALLVARITGHGWGPETDGCAEFCGTQHSFWVNGAAHEFGMRFERAGALWACADQVPNGVVPNQHGTFLYGRNGWCPGQDVAPWVADVTAALSPQGQLNSIAYCGALVNGSEPVRPAGVLLMQSNLVFQLSC